MPDWLQQGKPDEVLTWVDMLLRLGLAAAFGVAIAAVYAISQRRPPGLMIPLATTLVLLTVLVAMTTIVIGNSVARAFGLVGALSIVRFRTVVEDTRDTSFVIFAVVVGMALGAGNVLICFIGMPLVSVLALGLSQLGSNGLVLGKERRLEIRVGAGRDPEQLLAGVFGEQLRSWRLGSIVSARQGAALDLIYRVQLRDPSQTFALIKAITALEGVQNVELKED